MFLLLPCTLYKYGDKYKVVWKKTNTINNDHSKEKNIEYLNYIKLDKHKYITENSNNIYYSEIVEDENGLKDIRYYDYVGNDITKEFEKDTAKKKLKNNISRAKSKIFEYALCNEWQYFMTFTINEKLQDRFNLEEFIKDFGVWLGNYNKKYNTKVSYIIIPEKHKISGGWHLHGLMNGITTDSISINDNGYYELKYYKNRFGFMSMSTIKDKYKIASYITKYITKDMEERSEDIGKHLYYTSRGLKQKEIIYDITCDVPLNEKCFENDFCILKWYDDIPEFIINRLEEIYNENGVAI